MRKLALFGIALSLGLVLAACGGGGDGKKQSFTEDANQVCTQGQRKLVNIYLDRGLPSSPREQYDFDKAVVPVRDELLAGLRQLNPPADREQAFRRYLALRQALVAGTKALVVADDTGPAGAVTATRKKLDEIHRKSQKAAAQSGLDVCAVKLSPGEAKAVTAVISEFEVTADPQRACRDLATRQFMESRFPGGYGQCSAYTKKNAATYAKSVNVTHVEGTNGVLANVEYKDVGGSKAGVPSSATLYKIDGQWKIFAAQEEAPPH
jgi:hypothetical protein